MFRSQFCNGSCSGCSVSKQCSSGNDSPTSLALSSILLSPLP